MANVAFIGLDQVLATQIGRAIPVGSHQIRQEPGDALAGDLADADIVFASGEGNGYMPLLAGLRKARPTMPFVVVTQLPDTASWLDALEAGATDYCAAPFDARQMAWLLESSLVKP